VEGTQLGWGASVSADALFFFSLCNKLKFCGVPAVGPFAMEPGDLQVGVDDEHIVVTMAGTAFRASFFRSKDEPRLIQSPAISVEKDAPSARRKEFEALAWEAANAKARELGWID
jgi:hypothetical protein